jgi:ribosome-associated toxin RatA of RatAB toxin-antitoxin module
MHLENTILIDAPPDIIFRLAADVERWPDILPHYRYVRVLARRGSQSLVKMAALRDRIPVAWTSVLEPRPAERSILFRHVRGLTRGMAVEWRIEPRADGATHVSIQHDFAPTWPLVGGRVAHLVVGEFFVRNIAGKTLRRVKALAEAEHAAFARQASRA